jgi:hypothetical protein
VFSDDSEEPKHQNQYENAAQADSDIHSVSPNSPSGKPVMRSLSSVAATSVMGLKTDIVVDPTTRSQKGRISRRPTFRDDAFAIPTAETESGATS